MSPFSFFLFSFFFFPFSSRFSDTRPPGGLYDAVSDTSGGSAAATTQATDTMSGEVMPVAENSPSGQPAPETGAR
jgi:hypothetical protein